MGFSAAWEVKGRLDKGTIANIKLEVARDKKVLEDAAAAEKARADMIATRFETRLAKLKITNTTINREVRHETEKTVYGDLNCDVPPTGVMLINNSVREANRAAGYVPSEVPTPAGTAAGPGNDGGAVQPR